MLVGDVVCDSSLSARLASGSTWLEGQRLAPLLEGVQSLLGPAGQVDVDGGPHACAKVGGAGVEVAETGVQEELLARLVLDGIAHSLDATGKTLEDTTDITT